jgi:hypothetical protein
MTAAILSRNEDWGVQSGYAMNPLTYSNHRRSAAKQHIRCAGFFGSEQLLGASHKTANPFVIQWETVRDSRATRSYCR